MKAAVILLLSASLGLPFCVGNELTFLEPNKDYIIRFPDGMNLFQKTGAEPTTVTVGDKVQPTFMRYNFQLMIFRVIEKSPSSFVLLEHPAQMEDITAWDVKRAALAQLTDENIAILESSEEGRGRLERLRQAAERDIETDRTWVNLNLAAAIHEVPSSLTE